MEVELVAVERPIWSGDAALVIARTSEGDIGVLEGHTPLLAALEPGWVVRIVRDGSGSGDELRVAVHGGFLSVREDGVSILAEMAEQSDEIDVARAREALSRAERDLSSDQDDEQAVEARNRALARLRAAGESV